MVIKYKGTLKALCCGKKGYYLENVGTKQTTVWGPNQWESYHTWYGEDYYSVKRIDKLELDVIKVRAIYWQPGCRARRKAGWGHKSEYTVCLDCARRRGWEW